MGENVVNVLSINLLIGVKVAKMLLANSREKNQK
jgi:hypothetical protein